MRLPNQSPAVVRLPSTTASLIAGRVAAQVRIELGCDQACDPNNNQCASPCPLCMIVRGTSNYACQK